MEKQPDRKQGFFEKYLGWDTKGVGTQTVSWKDLSKREKSFYIISILFLSIMLSQLFFEWPLGVDIKFVGENIKKNQRIAVEEIKLISEEVEYSQIKVRTEFFSIMNGKGEMETNAEVLLENGKNITVKIYSDPFGNRIRKEIYLNGKIEHKKEIEANTLPKRLFNRMKFYTKF
jgi:regulatory protein YycI of two-component signal transduction system YycFG